MQFFIRKFSDSMAKIYFNRDIRLISRWYHKLLRNDFILDTDYLYCKMRENFCNARLSSPFLFYLKIQHFPYLVSMKPIHFLFSNTTILTIWRAFKIQQTHDDSEKHFRFINILIHQIRWRQVFI